MHLGPAGARSPFPRRPLAPAGTCSPLLQDPRLDSRARPAAIGPLAARATGRHPRLAEGPPTPRPGGNPFPATSPFPLSRGNLLPAAVPTKDRGNPLPAPRPPSALALAARRAALGRAGVRYLCRLVSACHPPRQGSARAAAPAEQAPRRREATLPVSQTRSRGAGGLPTRTRRLCGWRSPGAPR